MNQIANSGLVQRFPNAQLVLTKQEVATSA